jgi:hypothetical protein
MNVTAQVALKDAGPGKPYGNQVIYPLADHCVMYVAPIVASRIVDRATNPFGYYPFG